MNKKEFIEELKKINIEITKTQTRTIRIIQRSFNYRK